MKITFLDGRSFTLNAAQIAFLVIAGLTALNGFYDALSYEFAGPGDPHVNTFLYLPTDLYADLLKVSFLAPPFNEPDTTHWPPFIKSYCVDHNPYVRPDLLASHRVTGLSFLHITPVTLMSLMVVKKLLLVSSPVLVIDLFYLAAFSGLAAVCFALTPTRLSALGVMPILGLSYPFLMIVSRGNMGALAGGVALPFFFYFILRRPHLVAAVACLVAAALFRPNVLLLCPVLLGLGLPEAVLGSALAGLIVAAITAVFYHLDGLAYPGYGLAAHLSALKAYTDTCIIGTNGDQFNNSAFGAIKTIICCIHGRECRDIGGYLHLINLGAAGLFFVCLALGAFIYLRRGSSAFTLAFVALACLTLATTIFGSYHLFAFVAFPLLLLRIRADQPLTPDERLILLACVFILSPKNYIFVHDISLETIFNPLALAVTLGALLGRGLFRTMVQPAAGGERGWPPAIT